MNAAPTPIRPAPGAPPDALRRHVAALLAQYRPGFALPGPFFSDETLYAAELEYIFGRHWLFVATEAEMPEGGDYRTYQIGPLANLSPAARRRLARRVPQHLPPPRLAHPAAAAGIAGATLQCPYHRWTYDLDGRVVGCGDMDESPAAQRPLKPVHVRALAGLIFVCLADEAAG